MNKIFRLGFANIRRHRKESLLLALLVMFCMLLLGGSIAAEQNIRNMFPEMMERTGAWENCIWEQEKNYDPRFLDYLAEDDRISGFQTAVSISSTITRTPSEDGKTQLFMTEFFTEDNIRKQLRNFSVQTTLTDAEIAAAEHPVYVALDKNTSLGLKENDSITIIRGSRKFTFTVVGFFENDFTLFNSFVISDADYAVMKPLFTQDIRYHFDAKNRAEAESIAQDFCDKCQNTPGAKFDSAAMETYKDKQGNFDTDMMLILKILEVMAAIVILSVAVMIGYRIVSDIREQIVSIGVLEALGYRSVEIALSYAAEYFLIALAGCIAGTAGSLFLFRVLTGIAEHMEGYAVSHSLRFGTLLLVFSCILTAAALLAFCKALSVRKYPPVMAFRKGIANHHFGKSWFPLRNTKQNVHLRLGLKGFAGNPKQNISLTFVISITSLAVVLSFILFSFLGKGSNVINSIAGHEMSAIQVQTMPGVDSDTIIQELESVPGIRKALASSSSKYMYVGFAGTERAALADVFADYSQTENIFPMKGRFPAHDNEIMLTKVTSNETGYQIGDSVILKQSGVQKDYIVTGIVTALVNADSVYLTEDGMKRLVPTYTPDTFEVYTEEGVDSDTLRTLLDDKYGKSAADLGKEGTAEGSYEERIRARAEQVMSALMQQEGITHMEYSIEAGGQVISGNSSNIRIMDYQNFPEIVDSTLQTLILAISVLTKLFMALSAVIVMVILSILMASEIRRQRKELGIMKGMGYTAKELMFQLSFCIMPAALLGTVTGTVLGVVVTKVFVSTFIGAISVSIPAILALDVLILAFCFGCAYLGARKVKKISVYELMTE